MTVLTKSYASLPDVDRREVLRYAGMSDASEISDEICALLDECITLVDSAISVRVCYAEVDVKCEYGMTDLCILRAESKSMAKALDGCERAVVFAATVGIGVDRLIAAAGVREPSRALMLSAVGSERIETVCDLFCGEYAASLNITPRFSAGYGDIPLSLQQSICDALACTKNAGICLCDSMLMSPSKSVTAIFGIRKDKK